MKKITTGDILKIRKPQLKYPVIKPLKERFSPRWFSGEVKDEDLQSMFEAARYAPSGRNRQPWYFYWTKKKEASFEKLSSCISKRHNWWTKNAPVYVMACYIEENEFGKNEYALYDLGAAVISFVYQAQALGYYCRQVGNFDRDKAKKIFNLPKEQKPFVIIILGKIGDYTKAGQEIIDLDFVKGERKTTLSQKF